MSLWNWVSIKGQGHSLTLVKGHSDFNVKPCFSQKQLGDFEQMNVHMKAWGRMGMKIYTNELMANVAAMLIYVKNLGRFETKVHMKALGKMRMKIYTNELGHMIRQGQIWLLRLL